MAFGFSDILQVPARCLLQKRLPKAFFLKHFPLSAAEKKLLNNHVESIEWIGSLKPSTANIPAHVTDELAYEEIQLISVQMRDARVAEKGEACAQLVQKYLPYAVLLFVADADHFLVHTASKRVNQADRSKRVLERMVRSPVIPKLYKDPLSSAFFAALALPNLDTTDLYTTYRSYMQAVVQYRTAQLTGSFAKRTAKRSEKDMERLQQMADIERDLEALKKRVRTDMPLREKVELNMAIQQGRKQVATIKAKLTTE